MGRAPCCDKANVNKGPWSPEEDAKLKDYIHKYGIGGNWIALPQKVGLRRCGKSCRLRWLNYLRPNIKHGDFTEDEDMIICSLYTTIGSRWSTIASHLQGRTDNDIKNYWNTKLKKKLFSMVSSSSSSSHHIKKPTHKDSFSNQTNCATSPLGGPIISYPTSSSSNPNGLSNFQSQKDITTSFLDPLQHYLIAPNDIKITNNNVFMIKQEEMWPNQNYHIAPNDIFQDVGAQKLIFNDYGINYINDIGNVNHQWSDDHNTYYKESATDQSTRLPSMWDSQNCHHDQEKANGYAYPNVSLGYDIDIEEFKQQLMITNKIDNINGGGCYDNKTQQEEKAMYSYY